MSPRLRPVPGGGIPPGVQWVWIERPADPMMGAAPASKPISSRRYGVIETGRDLTPAELDHFDIDVILTA